MALEQGKDKNIIDLKIQLEQGEPSKAVKRRYRLENGLLYYLSNPDDNPSLVYTGKFKAVGRHPIS